MKYVIIADLHLQVSGYSKMIYNIPEKIYYPCLNLRKAADLAKQENAVLIIAGDLIEKKEEIPQIVLNFLWNTLDYCAQNVETYIVIGNHDYIIFQDTMYTYLKQQQFCEVAYPGQPIILGDLALIGHSENRDQIAEDFRNIDLETTRLIVSHFGLQEGLVGNTQYKGGEFSIRDFKEMKDVIMVLGHYHKPQQVADNIYYVGSPVPVRVDERDDEKRILLVNTDDMTVKSIPTEYPKFITKEIDYSDVVNIDEIRNEIESNLNSYVFVFPEDHPQNKEIKKLKEELKGHVFTYEKESDHSENEDSDDQIIDVKSEVTVLSIADEFLEKSKIPKDQREKYIQKIKDIAV